MENEKHFKKPANQLFPDKEKNEETLANSALLLSEKIDIMGNRLLLVEEMLIHWNDLIRKNDQEIKALEYQVNNSGIQDQNEKKMIEDRIQILHEIQQEFLETYEQMSQASSHILSIYDSLTDQEYQEDQDEWLNPDPDSLPRN